MKKIYIQPQTVAIKINGVTILAGSLMQNNESSASVADGNYSKSLGRGGWFDDDEE